MTTYSYTISMREGEVLALEDALKLMIDKCKQELEAGAKAPYWARLQDCEKLLKKLNSAEKEMLSTSSFVQGNSKAPGSSFS